MKGQDPTPEETILHSANELRIQGDFDLAIELLKDLINTPSASKNPILKINAMNELIICHRAFDDYEEAMELSIQVISLCIENKYDIGKAQAFINLGALSHISGSFTQAKDFFRQSLKIGEINNNNTIIARSLLHIGLISRDEGDIEKAEGDFYTAFKLLEQKTGSDESFNLSINALNYLALSSLFQMKITRAIELLNQALLLIKENFNYVKRPLVLRNLSLCNKIIDLDSQEYIDRALFDSLKRHKLQSNDLILSRLHKIIYLFEEYKFEKAIELYKEIKEDLHPKSTTIYFFIFLSKMMMLHELQSSDLEQELRILENLYRKHKKLIKDDKLVLMHIELGRILNDQTIAIRKNYSFGITRKYENLLRLARGHKESRIYLLCYTYLLELLIPFPSDNSPNDQNKDSVFTLLRQLSSDIKQYILLKSYFEIVEVLIHLYYTMEFNSNIIRLSKIKEIFIKNKINEREHFIFKLENDFTEKLSKLVEISEKNNLNEIKSLVTSYQNELRDRISTELRYFRFKIIHVLYLLNTFALK